MGAGKIVLLVFGIIFILVALTLLFGGGAALWVNTKTDSDGYISSSTIDIDRDSYAVVTGSIDIDEAALTALEILGMATDWQVEGSNKDPSKGIFIGVASTSDVEAYFNDVAYDEIHFADVGWLNLRDVTYTSHRGSSAPSSPTSQIIWIESEHGIGTQTMEWRTSVGSNSIVLMNDDGAAGIDLSAVVKVQIGTTIFAIGMGLLIGGIVVLTIGGFMVYFAVRRS